MKEEQQTSVEQVNTQPVNDAVTNNPLAYQKITSKKLEVVQNAKPMEKEKDKVPKQLVIGLIVVVIIVLIYGFIKIIYPTYFVKYFDKETACKFPFECKDNGDGTKRCLYYDERDKPNIVICKSDESGGSSADSGDKEKKTSLSKDDANRLLKQIKGGLDYSYGIKNLFDKGYKSKELLKDNRERLMFTYYYVSLEEDVYRDSETGLSKVDYTLLKNKYNELFEADFDDTCLNEDEFVQDGSLFVKVDLTEMDHRYLLKTKSIDEKKDIFTLTVDVLDYKDDDVYTSDDENFSTTTYDEELVKYTLEVVIKKVDENKFVIVSIK